MRDSSQADACAGEVQLREVLGLGETALSAAHARALLAASGGDVARAVNRHMDHGLAGLDVGGDTSAARGGGGASSSGGGGGGASSSGGGGGGDGGTKRAAPPTPGSAQKGKRVKLKPPPDATANQRSISSFFAKAGAGKAGDATAGTQEPCGSTSSTPSSQASPRKLLVPPRELLASPSKAAVRSVGEAAGSGRQARGDTEEAGGGRSKASASSAQSPQQSPARLMHLHSGATASGGGGGDGACRPSY